MNKLFLPLSRGSQRGADPPHTERLLRPPLTPPTQEGKKLLLEQAINLIELFAEIEIEVDAIEGGPPFVLRLRGQLAVGLHIRLRLLVHLTDLFLMATGIHLEDDVQTGGAGIVVGIGHLVVEGDETVADVKALGIAPKIKEHRGLGEEIEFAEGVGFESLIHDGERLLIVALGSIGIHQTGEKIGRIGKEGKALPEDFGIALFVAQTVPSLSHELYDEQARSDGG